MNLKPITAKELSVEQALFNSGWNILKRYGNISNKENDEEWERLIEEINSLYEFSKGRGKAVEQLSKSIALGVCNYLEARAIEKGT